MKKFPDFNDLVTLKTLQKNIIQRCNENKNGVEIKGLSVNSSAQINGQLFIAIPGGNVDGRDYIERAVAAGARAILLEENGITGPQQKTLEALNVPWATVTDLTKKLIEIADYFYSYPGDKLKLVGITGTNGKTSICQITAQIIKNLTGCCGQMGTLGNGLVGDLQPSLNTTSDVITTRKIFSEVVEAQAKFMLMEISSHALAQQRIKGLDFAVAVFTNLTQDHLDYHHTLEAYAAEKRKLFTDYNPKFVVLNQDDEFSRKLIEDEAIQAENIIYSIEKNNATKSVENFKLDNTYKVIASQVETLPFGQSFFLQTPWGNQQITISLLGEFNLSNVLAVIAILGCVGFSFAEIVAEIEKINPVAGRMETFKYKNNPVVVVDYAHTPDALNQALKALKAHFEGKLWCVFGCGGDRDRAKRSLMAAAVQKNADFIIVTDDNPRYEDGEQIVQDILAGLKNNKNVTIERDRKKAITQAIKLADSKDIILVAGKGHEDYQLVAGKTLSFSDRTLVKTLLKECHE